LPGLDVVEIVETALQRLAVECDDAHPGADRGEIQLGGMFAKRPFDIRRAEPLQDIRIYSGRPYAPAAVSI
jgi:hypothetical protein